MSTIVAIDGPSASGKSTVSRAVADALQFNYVDTGAMYRAFAWWCLNKQINPEDRDAVVRLLGKTKLAVEFREARSRVLVDGKDPGEAIRSEAVSACVSTVSAIPAVRKRMVDLQRSLAKEGDVVMEGRDIGTVVFPETPFKFFLDAQPEVRARRRAAELSSRASGASPLCTTAEADRVAQSLEKRDHLDSTRAASPLKVAADAIRIDTSDKAIAAVVDLILKEIRTKHFAR